MGNFQGFSEILNDLLGELQNPNSSGSFALRFHEIANSIKDLKDAYCSRWRLESQLPIATKKLKCVGGALSNCLNQLSLEAGRLAARFEKALLIQDEPSINPVVSIAPLKKDIERTTNPFDQPPETSCQNGHPEQGTSTDEMSRLKEIEDIRQVKPSQVTEPSEAMSSSLLTLETCEKQRSRITELETEREQLLVEIALLKRKAERAQKEREVNMADHTKNPSTSTSQSATSQPNEELTEVAVVKHFYSERLSETFSHLQSERDRAKHLTAECSSLLRRAIVAEDERNVLEERIKAVNNQKQQVEEELLTVRRGYEAQMGELTAHVAELNTRVGGMNGQQPGAAGGEDRSHPNRASNNNTTPRSSFARKLLFQK